ncbi:threonine synthase [Actinopolymorpha alba]|uniref:threonine synthase n=1 Tax=Actinopolymorpha alba TaxID=533267 RepID=UPI00036CF3B1|nr:pyridoxal-phosphate dependent enzyme [Actinopolymorpha alba]
MNDEPTRSLAIGQRSLGDPSISFPLFPPQTAGCPKTSGDEIAYPLEVAYDYGAVPADLFDRGVKAGLRHWAPLLPPLAPMLNLAEGGTPLLDLPALAAYAGVDVETFVKDESRNPTWSHKDRLNVCAVSAALLSGAPGVVVASAGNHGASAAAYAAAAGLPCVVITTADGPPAVRAFVSAYGAAVLAVSREARWDVLAMVVDRLGYHPVSNRTVTHTGHPFGPEGYKTIAYELFLQLGRRVPGAVFVPTGYGELLYGVWKGFLELRDLGHTRTVPRLYACEPERRGPLAAALRAGAPAAHVAARPTAAYSIGCTTSGYRGVLAIRGSGGEAVLVTEAELESATQAMAKAGLWAESSGAAALAGLRRVADRLQPEEGPVVCLSTSSGFKNPDVCEATLRTTEPSWSAVAAELAGLGVEVPG